ncbi:MAG: hypothetical protein NZM42_12645 [Gemmatales bacterium]|nr:hypothetical protein [Gemmatales bacterium]
MDDLKHPLWIVDAPAVAAAIRDALTGLLDHPVQPMTPSDVTDEPVCAAALVEILLPDACGLTMASSLRFTIHVPVAVWGTRPLPLYAWVAWQVGLNGCLDKNMAWGDMVAHVQLLLQGASVWPPPIWEQVQAFEEQTGKRLRQLNATEWARWLDMVGGGSLKQLAAMWGITLRGAAKARDRLCEKLGVGDETEAVKLAWSAGMVKMGHDPRWSEAVLLYQAHSTLASASPPAANPPTGED